MFGRALTMVAGLTGAAGTSQFPEFSQQYVQRLGGTVDALQEVVTDFDTSARASGLTRDDALAKMTGSDFLDRRRTDMTRTIARADRLADDLALLETAGPFTRAYYAARFTDRDVAQGAFEAYRPGVQLSFEGVIFAVVGFVLGGGVFSMLWSFLRWPFRRRAGAG